MIVVFGGTGMLGRQIVDRLQSKGNSVRVVTRDRALVQPVGSVELVAADLHDRDSLVVALTGATAVVCTVQGGQGKGKKNGPRGIEGSGIPALIQEARDAPIEHFIYLSSASAHADNPVDFFRLKFQAERALSESGLPYSILRPTHLMDTWVKTLAEPLAKNGRALVLGSGKNPVSWVAGTDVARVAGDLTCHPGQGQTSDLGGPEALTIRQANELVAAWLGVQIRGENKMPVTTLRVMSRLVRPFNEVLARRLSMGAALDTQPQVVDSSPIWAQLGAPLSLSAWLQNHPAGQ
jgi:uncharacterized protein YbjT (DUF2867 family)